MLKAGLVVAAAAVLAASPYGVLAETWGRLPVLPHTGDDFATPLGAIRFKVASRNGRIVNASPEFDDCVRVAAVHARTVKDIQALAVQCYGERHSEQDGPS